MESPLAVHNFKHNMTQMVPLSINIMIIGTDK